jgi:hypothetical protein
MFACVMLSSSAFANCTTNARGMTECNDGQAVGGYNPNTGNAVTAQKNQNGVTTTQTSKGERPRRRTERVFIKARAERHVTRAPAVRDAIEHIRLRCGCGMAQRDGQAWNRVDEGDTAAGQRRPNG